MRLASFMGNGHESFGVVREDGIVDARKHLGPEWPSLRAVLAAGRLELLRRLGSLTPEVDLGSVRFLPVIPDPGKILCVGVNYLAHIKEMGREPPDKPVIFVRFADSQVGHGQPMVHPGVSEQYDYEGELAVVIDLKKCAEKALDVRQSFDLSSRFASYPEIETINPVETDFRVLWPRPGVGGADCL